MSQVIITNPTLRCAAEVGLVEMFCDEFRKHSICDPLNRSIEMEDTIIQKFDTFPYSEMLREDGWLAYFISAVEELPMGCTLSSVEADNASSFPLIYANKRFAEMAGCPRTVLAGKSCTFLQTKQTLQFPDQQRAIDQLILAVRNSREYTTCILCSTASNMLFENWIGVKPIGTANAEDGRHFFVTFQIALNIDDCAKCKAAVIQIQELIEALPY